MKMNNNLEKDYRKWILFNDQLGEFHNLYELYTSVEMKKGKGGVSIGQIERPDGASLIVEQVGYAMSLEIVGEAERRRFLEYLVQHYFPDKEIEEWYQSKLEEKEKSENHGTSPNARVHSPSAIDFKIHPKETLYYRFRIFISVCFYLALMVPVISAFTISISSGMFAIAMVLVVILIFGLLRRVAQGFFIGLIKGFSVKLNEYQYPEIYKVVKDQSRLIELSETPDVYIVYGHFNAFVTKFARRKFLVLFSEVLETASKGNFEVLKFVVGHELGHIKRQHLSREKWLVPSSFVPFLKQAHSRGCEYTCDRIGYHFSAKGAREGILILAAGKEIYSKINVNRYVEDSNSENDFWVWISEKFLSHPYTFKRMTAIQDYDASGY